MFAIDVRPDLVDWYLRWDAHVIRNISERPFDGPPPHLETREVASILASRHSEFENCHVEHFHQGWDNSVYIVDGQWVFRFGRNTGAGRRLLLEDRVLPSLRNKTTLAIPQIHFAGHDPVYSGHRVLVGERFTRHLKAMSETGRKVPLGQLAGFLAEIHDAISVQEGRRLGLETTLGLWDQGDQIQEHLLSNYAGTPWFSFAVDSYTRFVSYRDNPGELSYVHHDTHSNNLLVDPESGKLTSVLDFGEQCVADRHRDFHMMVRHDMEIMSVVVDEYEAITSTKLDRRRIVDYRISVALYDLYQNRADGTWRPKFERELLQLHGLYAGKKL